MMKELLLYFVFPVLFCIFCGVLITYVSDVLARYMDRDK